MYRMTAYAAVLVVLSLVAVATVRVMLYGPPVIQTAAAGPSIELDAELAARNLSKAIRIRTVSYDNELLPDAGGFAEFHEFLRTSFPLIHQVMTRENGHA